VIRSWIEKKPQGYADSALRYRTRGAMGHPLFFVCVAGKGLAEGEFVCVAAKGVTVDFAACVAGKGVRKRRV